MEKYCSLQMSWQGQNEKRQIISMNGTYFGGQHAVVVSVELSYVKNTLKQNENFHEKSSKEDVPCF